ncbi:MAG: DUF1501 domain-containing protein [Verrucomicrobia bacterium]|nr:DUF1501 domain-containing protein [Verrucomicrobiota bacterium]
MDNFHLLTRRSFLDRGMKIGLGVALSTLVDIPMLMKRALAQGTLGLDGKKLLFVFLRGANDGLNSLIPALDPAYNTTNRPHILIPSDPATDYSAAGPCDWPVSALPTDPTFAYGHAIRVGNGFAALHPSLKFLAPVYNTGDLALVHRVGYPNQSRSHFSSQNYWETAEPNNDLVLDGVFYRAMVESGLANSSPLTGVSVQSALPLSLRGSAAAMTNLTNPTRYDLIGIPEPLANLKAGNAVRAADLFPFPAKQNRELLSLQFQNLTNTIAIFKQINFTEAGNTFKDDANTDGDTGPYYLFPTTNAKNGGYALHANNTGKYVVDPSAYGFFTNLKAAALILNKTDAIVAGTEMYGFDTHNQQGSVTGTQANLLRTIGWMMYGLRKYFLNYADKATWNNLVVVTLSEFGRTTIQNASLGTDHAEASVMFLAGGAIKGYNKGNPSGVFGCQPADKIPWITGQTGSMFGVIKRYLKRTTDYRSVLGKIIRDHLGATQDQLNGIIPGYASAGEQLLAGGTSNIDGTPIVGELPLV